VIYRAISATNELFEAVGSAGLAEGDIDLEVSFDEFNLDVVARYRGEPPVLPSRRPDVVDLLGEGPSASLAAFMVTRYANSVRVDTRDGACRVRLTFDH
jgi:hypothetical protein